MASDRPAPFSDPAYLRQLAQTVSDQAGWTSEPEERKRLMMAAQFIKVKAREAREQQKRADQ